MTRHLVAPLLSPAAIALSRSTRSYVGILRVIAKARFGGDDRRLELLARGLVGGADDFAVVGIAYVQRLVGFGHSPARYIGYAVCAMVCPPVA